MRSEKDGIGLLAKLELFDNIRIVLYTRYDGTVRFWIGTYSANR